MLFRDVPKYVGLLFMKQSPGLASLGYSVQKPPTQATLLKREFNFILILEESAFTTSQICTFFVCNFRSPSRRKAVQSRPHRSAVWRGQAQPSLLTLVWIREQKFVHSRISFIVHNPNNNGSNELKIAQNMKH